MKYKFRDNVRKALANARAEALALGHDYVGPEHMLLGLLRAPASRAVELLGRYGVGIEQVRKSLDARIRRGSASVSMGELPYTSRGKKVLEYAMTAARELRDADIDTQHLLVGLLQEEKGIAATVLVDLGVTLTRVRVTLVTGEDPDAGTVSASRTGRRGPAFRIELDDNSDRSIYEQIVARVQEEVATGELAPGERLPAVRQLADQLDIAPGTVARAYGELERIGVVVTEGARGTRIAKPGGAEVRSVDLEHIAGLLRPAAVAAFHMGAGAPDLRRALEAAMTGIFAE